jgi:hypothetical protein
MDDSNTQTAVVIAVLQEKINSLEERQDQDGAKIAALEQDRNNALRWGIMVLGSAVVSMGAWIFQLFSDRLK